MKLSKKMIAELDAKGMLQDARPEPPQAPRVLLSPRRGFVDWSVDLGVGIRLPIEVKSEANQREHWAARHSRFKKQRAALRSAAVAHAFGVLVAIKVAIDSGSRACVVFQRLGVKKMDDDNLAGAFKGIRDEMAKLLGVDDADDRIEWRYEQKVSASKGVHVTVGVRVPAQKEVSE